MIQQQWTTNKISTNTFSLALQWHQFYFKHDVTGKAIELFNECLVLLERHASEMIDSRRSAFTTLVYERLFSLYYLVGDHARALQSREKARGMHSQSGNADSAEALLTKVFDMYCSMREGGGDGKNSFEEGMLLVRQRYHI